MSSARVLQEILLDYPGDSTEFSPIAEFANTLAVGSYQLNEQEKTRSGELLLCELKQQPTTQQFTLETLCKIPSSGILDLKWSSRRVGDAVVLGSANADGLMIFDCKDLSKNASPAVLSSHKLEDKGNLSLSLDWNNKVREVQPKIATSQSDKTISLFNLTPTGISVESHFTAHQHEIWVVSFNYFAPSQLLSGSDDCTMKGWDCREHPSQPTFSRRFDAGVTSIQFSHLREHIFAVGSYDDHVRIFDIRTIGPRSQPLASAAMGGGVFRVKWHPRDPNRLATANMYNGFATLSVMPGASELRVDVGHTKPHESLAYGTDWCHREDCGDLLASASFYDKRMTLWKEQKGE